MVKHVTSIALMFAALLGISPAVAQDSGTATTGGGTEQRSKDYAPYVAPTGKTMPPAGAGRVDDRTAIREDDKRESGSRKAEQEKSDEVLKGICIGCGVK